MRFRKRITRLALGLSALGLAVLFAGLFVFAAFTTRPIVDDRATADGIVVLTGGKHRLLTGGRLLREGRAKRLLISGANRVASRADLRRLTGLSAKTFDCCVDVGYEARNTRENATETEQWLREQGFKKLIVVTSSYHMPRSLVELSRRLPGVELHAHPVRAAPPGRGPWWMDSQSARTLVAEYVKFLPAAGWYIIQACVGGAPNTANKARHDQPPKSAPSRQLGRSS